MSNNTDDECLTRATLTCMVLILYLSFTYTNIKRPNKFKFARLVLPYTKIRNTISQLEILSEIGLINRRSFYYTGQIHSIWDGHMIISALNNIYAGKNASMIKSLPYCYTMKTFDQG